MIGAAWEQTVNQNDPFAMLQRTDGGGYAQTEDGHLIDSSGNRSALTIDDVTNYTINQNKAGGEVVTQGGMSFWRQDTASPWFHLNGYDPNSGPLMKQSLPQYWERGLSAGADKVLFTPEDGVKERGWLVKDVSEIPSNINGGAAWFDRNTGGFRSVRDREQGFYDADLVADRIAPIALVAGFSYLSGGLVGGAYGTIAGGAAAGATGATVAGNINGQDSETIQMNALMGAAKGAAAGYAASKVGTTSTGNMPSSTATGTNTESSTWGSLQNFAKAAEPYVSTALKAYSLFASGKASAEGIAANTVSAAQKVRVENSPKAKQSAEKDEQDKAESDAEGGFEVAGLKELLAVMAGLFLVGAI